MPSHGSCLLFQCVYQEHPPPSDEQSPSSWRHQCIFHRCISMHYLSLWVLTSTFSACLQRNDSAIANLPAFPPQSNQDTSCMLDTVIALSSLLGLELPFPHLGECNSHNISVLSERKENHYSRIKTLLAKRTQQSGKKRSNHFVPVTNKTFHASRRHILTISCKQSSTPSNKVALCCTGFLSCRCYFSILGRIF